MAVCDDAFVASITDSVLDFQSKKGLDHVEKDVGEAMRYFSAAGRQRHLRAKHWKSYILMREHRGAFSWLHGLAIRLSGLFSLRLSDDQ